MTEQPLLAERELLPAEAERERRLRIADVGKARSQIERTAERCRRRSDLFVRNARVLHVGLERERFRGGDRGVEADAAERVVVVSTGREARVVEALDAFAEFAAHAQPF